jgi:hypothetical protein
MMMHCHDQHWTCQQASYGFTVCMHANTSRLIAELIAAGILLVADAFAA